MRQPIHKKNSGFTLIEMLVVIAVIGVFSAIGIPAFQTMIANNQQIAAMNQTKQFLGAMRSLAVTTGNPVQVTLDGNTLTAAQPDPNSANWLTINQMNLDAQLGTTANNATQSVFTFVRSGSVQPNQAITFRFAHPQAQEVNTTTVTLTGAIRIAVNNR